MLLTAKTLKEEKIKLYHAQNGICPLCNLELDKNILSNHLDHDHALDGNKAGKVRGLLCNLCNSLEGQIKHKFGRSGLVSKNTDINTWLLNLIEYYKADLSLNNIHPKFVPDKVKSFSRLNKSQMISELNSLNINFDNSLSKEQLTKLYNKQLRLSLKG